MKKGLLLIGILVFLGSCKDKVYEKYMANVPVYTDYEVFRSTGGFEAARPIEQQGNIYFKDGYLFLVEPDKGIHFIDNTNPVSPVQTGFLNVWGATGMAIKGNFLYVNSFIDLVVYDISSFSSPVEVTRLKDVFPGALPVSDKNYPYQPIDKSLGVITSWKVEKVKNEITDQYPTWTNCPTCTENITFDGSVALDGGSGSGSTGISGSISLFTIVDDYLYIIENGNFLHPIAIANPSAPILYPAVGVWGGVETLFPYQNYIFMGTPSGMLIYETSNPEKPTYIGGLSHARGCDPVVVKDDYAYVTVRSGGSCGGDINQLDVIDISTITNPILKNSFALKNPHGLGIDGTTLFVCDGDEGLKIFDATNPEECGNNLIDRFKNIQATDVIPFGNIAMVVGDDGIFQYSYETPGEIILLSEIRF